ncbi:hypothetical protein [Mycobacterium sp.]|uniref:hypothetical protein n=1 Tax=Mycobacterium sp. TaxID=1785 RepID=UPI002B8F45F8|nr:hypothetical protein [Mycobacterium sp.]HME48845.1 hypothetical protein [Mycobacterium sp.]
MGDEDTGQKNAEQHQDPGDNPGRAGQLAEKPEPDESAREKAREMAKAYNDDIKTAVLPGSDRTITGTAVNDWLDDQGNPKYGNEAENAESRSDGGSES